MEQKKFMDIQRLKEGYADGFVPGDLIVFPTGGIVVNKDDLVKIYESGTGKLRIRGRVEIEKLKGGRH